MERITALQCYLDSERQAHYSWANLCTDVMTAECWAEILVVLQKVHAGIREREHMIDVGRVSEGTRGWFQCQGYPIIGSQLFLPVFN